jgi:group I intron endonuclease
MHTISKSNGVYIIRCKINNFVYIGSASGKRGFRKRLSFHLWHLQKGTHHSNILQSHFDRYGKDAFEFEIAIVCPPEKCLDFEQALLRARGIGSQNECYNLSAHVTYAGWAKRKATTKPRPPVSEETRRKLSEANKGKFVSAETRRKISEAGRGRKMPPESVARMAAKNRGAKRSPEIIERMRLAQQARELSPEFRAAMGKRAKEANSKQYVATSPSGEEFQVTGLADFCRSNGLCRTQMSNCANGKATHYKGWKCRFASTSKEEQDSAIALVISLQRRNRDYIFIDPDGNSYLSSSFASFCELHDLSISVMSLIANGKKRIYKGWMCYQVAEPEEVTIARQKLRGRGRDFVVTSPDGQEISVNDLKNFCTGKELCPSSLTKVARGKRPHHKGWLCRYASEGTLASEP